MTRQHLGWGILAFAFLMLLGNISDIIGQWQNWEFASTPAFIAAVLKQISVVGTAAIGGKLLPSGDQHG